jgi:hypothetical protein
VRTSNDPSIPICTTLIVPSAIGRSAFGERVLTPRARPA